MRHAMKKPISNTGRVMWRCLQRLVRNEPWTYGKLKSLEARKHKDGQVEIFAPRSNPDHSLWIETHRDHWNTFTPNGELNHE